MSHNNSLSNTSLVPVSDTPTSPASLPSSSQSVFPTNTAAFSDSTYSSTNGSTTALPYKGAGPAGTAVAIIITIAVILAFLTLICCYLKKKGKLTKLPCYKPVSRMRKSSTSSSRRALEEHEVMEHSSRPKPDGQADDMFTIDDFDGTTDPQEGREEYYYDEVFGQSQFEDETTNNAMRQLYSDSQAPPEEEMLDLDFETLGIKIEDYTPEMARKNTA